MFTDLVAALRAYFMCFKRPSKTCRGHVVVSGWEFVKYCCFGKICPGAFLSLDSWGEHGWQNLHIWCALCNKIGKEKEKTTPFGINSMRSQVLYQAAQEQQNNMLWEFYVHSPTRGENRCTPAGNRFQTDGNNISNFSPLEGSWKTRTPLKSVRASGAKCTIQSCNTFFADGLQRLTVTT